MKRTRIMAAFIVATLGITGCTVSVSGPSSETSSVKTVDGMTQGHASKSTSDNGSASFSVKDHHIDMTNFSFDADESGKVQAELNEDGLVYAKVLVHDGNMIWQSVVDGLYTENFSADSAKEQLNTIYQLSTGASDTPISENDIYHENGVIYSYLGLTDGEMIVILKEGTNKYITIAYTTMEHGTEEILNSAYNTLIQ